MPNWLWSRLGSPKGVPWPKEVQFDKKPEKRRSSPLLLPPPKLANVRRIREMIMAKKADAKAATYSVTIPSTTVSYDMTPIAAGDFEMGKHRQAR